MSGWLRLEHPLVVAAGCAKTPDDVARLARSSAAAVTVGSVTVEARDGNPGEVFARIDRSTVNALGMPNRGLDVYLRWLPRMVASCRDAGVPLVVSVAGERVDEYELLAEAVSGTGVDALECNLGCPNVLVRGERSRIPSFDPDLVRAVVERTATGIPRSIKVSPISDPSLLSEVADAASSADAVVAINTFPTGALPGIRLGSGGGLGGEGLRLVALGQVAAWRARLPEMPIVGVGGVSDGTSMRAMLAAGADSVGIASAYWIRGEDPGVFTDVLADWLA